MMKDLLVVRKWDLLNFALWQTWLQSVNSFIVSTYCGYYIIYNQVGEKSEYLKAQEIQGFVLVQKTWKILVYGLQYMYKADWLWRSLKIHGLGSNWSSPLPFFVCFICYLKKGFKPTTHNKVGRHVWSPKDECNLGPYVAGPVFVLIRHFLRMLRRRAMRSSPILVSWQGWSRN